MAKDVGLGDMQAKGQDIKVGQDGGEQPGDQQAAWNGELAEAEAQGEGWREVGKDGWHVWRFMRGRRSAWTVQRLNDSARRLVTALYFSLWLSLYSKVNCVHQSSWIRILP